MRFLHERPGCLNEISAWETRLFKSFLCLMAVWMIILPETRLFEWSFCLRQGCLNDHSAWDKAVWMIILPETRLFEWSFCLRQGCLNDFSAWMTSWLNGKTFEWCLFEWHAVWLASCLNSCLHHEETCMAAMNVFLPDWLTQKTTESLEVNWVNHCLTRSSMS